MMYSIIKCYFTNLFYHHEHENDHLTVWRGCNMGHLPSLTAEKAIKLSENGEVFVEFASTMCRGTSPGSIKKTPPSLKNAKK